MTLTPLAKGFITVVILGVLGFVAWFWFGGSIKNWATGGKTGVVEEVKKEDFDSLKNTKGDAKYNDGSTGVNAAQIGTGKLTRPLVVAINTWAGHAPGIVYNNGLDPNANSSYKKNFGLDVKFVVIEDPAAKLAAFRKGDVDIMWDTVDNWAREASILAEQNQAAKSIIMQDWSRGGDGIVALKTINSVEDLKGKTMGVQAQRAGLRLLTVMRSRKISSLRRTLLWRRQRFGRKMLMRRLLGSRIYLRRSKPEATKRGFWFRPPPRRMSSPTR